MLLSRMTQKHFLCFVCVRELFAGSDSAGGASLSASAAIDAGIGID